MKAFLKENLVLIAGIALPLLLGIGFLVATKVSVIGIAPPQTSVLYFYKNYGPADFKVRDGVVYYHETGPKPANYDFRRETELYIFDPVKGERRRIDLPDVPEDGTGKDGLPVEGLKDLKISDAPESPDGFVFRNGWEHSYNGGLVLEIFGGSRHDRNAYLQKGALKVEIADQNQPYYRQPAFIGWVIE